MKTGDGPIRLKSADDVMMTLASPARESGVPGTGL